MAPGSEAEALLESLTASGLRRTRQRRAIASVLASLGRAASLEEIHARVREEMPNVGFSTVYRTMKSLVEAGSARENRFADGIVRYTLGPRRGGAAHFVCTSCGLVEEIAASGAKRLIERLVRAAPGEVETVRIELDGFCRACRKALGRRRR